jgi:hypothetical protein
MRPWTINIRIGLRWRIVGAAAAAEATRLALPHFQCLSIGFNASVCLNPDTLNPAPNGSVGRDQQDELSREMIKIPHADTQLKPAQRRPHESEPFAEERELLRALFVFVSALYFYPRLPPKLSQPARAARHKNRSRRTTTAASRRAATATYLRSAYILFMEATSTDCT